MVPLAYLISRLSGWFRWWGSNGIGFVRMSSSRSRWRAAQDHKGAWRVVGNDHKVICNDCTEENANEIARAHNLVERDREYNDWLFHKAKEC